MSTTAHNWTTPSGLGTATPPADTSEGDQPRPRNDDPALEGPGGGGGAISDSLKATAQGTVAGQGAAGIANLGVKIFNPHPGQEPVKFGDVAGAAMGALAMGPIGLPRLMDVMNVARAPNPCRAPERVHPDTIQVRVELPNQSSAFLLLHVARFADAHVFGRSESDHHGSTAAVAPVR
jgi:hypothetical protein